jgi:ankyrin repeat protein
MRATGAPFRRFCLLPFALCAVLVVVSAPSFAASRLIDAVKRGDVNAVRALAAQKADVNAQDADGSTALHWAAQRDDVVMVDALIAAGANVKAKTRYNVTPLSLACTNGDAKLVDRLLKAGADPNERSEEGQTALMISSLTGKPDAVKLLVETGADVNAVEPYKGQTALMWAASEGNAAAVDVLLTHGADVNAKSKSGFTPLLFAVRNDHRDSAEALLNHSANVNDVAPDGTSALNMAVVNAYFDLAAFLLDRGANPNASDPRGSALHTLAWLRKPGSDGAAGVGNTGHAPPLPSGRMTALELAKRLLDHGANPNIRVGWKENTFGKEGGTARNPPNIQLGRHLLSYVGATPFYVAAKNGDAPYMKLLADHGADPLMTTKAGITPLMVAAGLDYWEGEAPGPFTGVSEAERLDAVKLAVALGNDVNAHADFGDYPMTGETAYTLLYYPHNIDDLLELGVGDPRWSGATPLIGAVVSGQPSIVQWLVDHNARVDDTTKLGWTPLLVAEGVFFANAKKEFPQAAVILRKALAARGPSAGNH